jgi:hypothetical protein
MHHAIKAEDRCVLNTVSEDYHLHLLEYGAVQNGSSLPTFQKKTCCLHLLDRQQKQQDPPELQNFLPDCNTISIVTQ